MWDKLKLNYQMGSKSTDIQRNPFFQGVGAVTLRNAALEGLRDTVKPADPPHQWVWTGSFLLPTKGSRTSSGSRKRGPSITHRCLIEWIIFKIIIPSDFHLYTEEGGLWGRPDHTFLSKLWAKDLPPCRPKKSLETHWVRCIDTVPSGLRGWGTRESVWQLPNPRHGSGSWLTPVPLGTGQYHPFPLPTSPPQHSEHREWS